MKSLLRKVVTEKSSASRFITVFGILFVTSVVDGIVLGWLYNQYPLSIFLFTLVADAVLAFFCLAYFLVLLANVYVKAKR